MSKKKKEMWEYIKEFRENKNALRGK